MATIAYSSTHRHGRRTVARQKFPICDKFRVQFINAIHPNSCVQNCRFPSRAITSMIYSSYHLSVNIPLGQLSASSDRKRIVELTEFDGQADISQNDEGECLDSMTAPNN